MTTRTLTSLKIQPLTPNLLPTLKMSFELDGLLQNKVLMYDWSMRECKGITLDMCLVTWVGSHLRAVILPIALSLPPIFPSVTYCVIPLKLLLDLV